MRDLGQPAARILAIAGMNIKRTRAENCKPEILDPVPPVRSGNARLCVSLFFAACILLPGAASAQGPVATDPEVPTSQIRGTVTRIDPQGNSTALEGVPVTLGDSTQNTAPMSTLSGADGGFQFEGLSVGTYSLEVNLKGFKPFAKTIALQSGELHLQDIHLEIESVATSILVQAQADTVTEHSSDPNATLTEQEFPALPMAQQKYSEALPTIPGVIRSLDGTLNIKGQSESQGMLLVDSGQMIDPVTGSFSVGVPLASVDTLNVYETPYNAQYGGFSGGLTTIETKAPPSRWQYSLMDFVPGVRGKNGQIVGVSAETPRAFVGGPLIKDKLNISESFDYTIKNHPVRGLPWPVDETRIRGFNSFTDLQAILSTRHLLTGSVVAFSNHTQFADISSLLPQKASSNTGSKGAYVTINDSYQLESGTLLTMFRYSRFDSNAYGQGSEPLLLTPEARAGNAFNNWKRTANQFQASPVFQLARKTWHGSHDIEVGSNIVHQYYDGTSQSRPIMLLREDGTLAERIDFQGPGVLNGSGTEVSEFVQDHWVPTARLAVDAGIRLSTQSNGRSAAFAPRLGLAYSLDRANKTVLRLGAGVFYDRVSLLATSFTQNPMRVVSLYNSTGSLIGQPVAFQNVFVDWNSLGQPVLNAGRDPGTSPRNFTWNAEVDREVNSRLTLRFGYLQSQTSDLYLVAPWTGASTSDPVLGLSHTGNSHYREFQAGVHYRPGRRGDLTVTYLHSRSKGSLSTLSDAYIPVEQPIIRPNLNGYLDSDVPNRLLASGIFHLPGGFTISPVVDLHTGFRYSNLDVLQNYVGTPNSQRFPTYFSLDTKVYRDFPLPAFAG